MISLLATASRVMRAAQRLRPANRLAGRNRGEFYRRVWRDAAEAIGAEAYPLDDEIIEIVYQGRGTRVCRNYTELENPVALKIAGNKSLVHRLLNQHALPTPIHVSFTPRTIARAAEFLERQVGPCVVKPSDGTGAGSGVTTNIRNRAQLIRAATAAAGYGRQLLIEQQVRGENYRLLYIDGHLIDAIRRRPPMVIGDGRSTVARLIQQHNAQRLRQGGNTGEAQVTWNADLRWTLADQQLSRRSVPPAGTAVVVKTAINENAAEENESVGDILSASVVEAGAEAARLVGARLAGVDLITADPTRPLAEAGGVVLEVNTTPGFHFHYSKRDGPTPVAEHVLRHIFDCVPPAGQVKRLRRANEAVTAEEEFP